MSVNWVTIFSKSKNLIFHKEKLAAISTMKFHIFMNEIASYKNHKYKKRKSK